MTAEALVHRSGHALPEHLAEALRVYEEHLGHLPSRITVHNSQVAAALAVVPTETDIAVDGLGGCLANEIWLWLPEENEGERS
jgi:hypothetical protein